LPVQFEEPALFSRRRFSFLLQAVAVAALVVAGQPATAWAQEALPLQSAIEQALAGNVDLSVASARLQEARASRAKITTAWLPNLQAIGSYTHNSVEAKFDSGKLITGVAQILAPGVQIPASSLPPASYIQKADQLTGVLQLDQTLFALSPLLLAKAADSGVAAQAAGLLAAKREIAFQISQVYYNYASVVRLTAVADRAITLADQRIVLVEQRLRAGADSELALLRAQAEHDRAVLDRTRAEAARRQLLLVVAALTGKPAPAALAEPPDQVPPTGGPDGWLAQARDQRPDVTARDKAVQAAEQQVQEAQWRWVPTLSLQAQARWSNVAGFAGQNAVWLATANLVVPIFDRGQRYADAKERRAAVHRATTERDKLLTDLQTAMQQAQLDRQQALDVLAMTQTQASRAKRTAAIVAAAYAAGGATSLEVAEADTQLRAAETGVERERLQVDLAVLRLRHLLGLVQTP
jgi:outer membrane protein TolC